MVPIRIRRDGEFNLRYMSGAQTPVDNNTIDKDAIMFVAMDGDYSRASGALRKRLAENRRNRLQKQKARMDLRKQRVGAKTIQAKAQQSAAKSIGKDNTAATLAALSNNPAPVSAPEEKGMSKGLKTGLIIGGVALAAIIGFVVYKKMKKK